MRRSGGYHRSDVTKKRLDLDWSSTEVNGFAYLTCNGGPRETSDKRSEHAVCEGNVCKATREVDTRPGDDTNEAEDG